MAVERARRSQILVRVLDVNGKVLENAAVRVNGNPIRYDPRLRAYPTADVDPGSYSVAVEAPDLEPQHRDVSVENRPVHARFVLGKAGLPHYYRGPVKVPYDLPPMVAVALKPEAAGLPTSLIEVARDLGFDTAPVPSHAVSKRVRIFRAPADRPDITTQFERKLMSPELRDRIVLRAGHVVRYNEESLSFLTNECVVKFQPQVNAEDETRRRNLTILRRVPYSANTFLIQSNPSMTSTDLLDICNAWATSGATVWAEPNLVSTVVAHSPNDPRLMQQGHHAIIDSQGAWDIVKAAMIAGEASDVVIAVTDTGCLTSHEDLQDILSRWFNFSDNSSTLLENPHGTMSCGIAAAVVGNGKGVAGIAGFPDFCSLVAVQIPTFVPDAAGNATEVTEINYADMFVWCAGFDNGQPDLPLLVPGADVISNSWTLDGMAESGVVAAAFDVLASDGRNGLGCVVVFAAGNNGTDYTLEYPLATHPALITVAASTIVGAEVKVSDSNFGPYIDVCAPAGDGNPGTSTVSTSITSTFPLASDYDDFGRTSAACPQVAGVAALMLAVNASLEAEEVRDILQSTAVKIDNTNTDPLGLYHANGHSQWYGYGRIDAQAAVQAAAGYTSGVPPAPPTGVRVIT